MEMEEFHLCKPRCNERLNFTLTYHSHWVLFLIIQWTVVLTIWFDRGLMETHLSDSRNHVQRKAIVRSAKQSDLFGVGSQSSEFWEVINQYIVTLSSRTAYNSGQNPLGDFIRGQTKANKWIRQPVLNMTSPNPVGFPCVSILTLKLHLPVFLWRESHWVESEINHVIIWNPRGSLFVEYAVRQLALHGLVCWSSLNDLTVAAPCANVLFSG